jgi:hypothetical protein
VVFGQLPQPQPMWLLFMGNHKVKRLQISPHTFEELTENILREVYSVSQEERQCMNVNFLWRCQECMRNKRAFPAYAVIWVHLFVMCIGYWFVDHIMSLNVCSLSWHELVSSKMICNRLPDNLYIMRVTKKSLVVWVCISELCSHLYEFS